MFKVQGFSVDGEVLMSEKVQQRCILIVRFIRVFKVSLSVFFLYVLLEYLVCVIHICQGEGVAGAKIYLNTEMKAVTDSNGKYRLYNITSGLYLFQAS